MALSWLVCQDATDHPFFQLPKHKRTDTPQFFPTLALIYGIRRFNSQHVYAPIILLPPSFTLQWLRTQRQRSLARASAQFHTTQRRLQSGTQRRMNGNRRRYDISQQLPTYGANCLDYLANLSSITGPQDASPIFPPRIPQTRPSSYPPRWSLPGQARYPPEPPWPGCSSRQRSIQDQRCSHSKSQCQICHCDVN